MLFSQYTTKSVEEIIKEFKTSHVGLSEKEVVLAQKKYGLNEIRVKPLSIFDILTRQFKSPFIYLLVIAALIAVLIGERIDGAIILFFILINVAIGFFQEYKSEKAVFLLQKFIPQKVKVLRDSKEKIIDKKLLVPGDIVLLEVGDMVCADLRIIDKYNFLVDESALSGESIPVSKIENALPSKGEEIFDAKNIAFSGSFVVSGKAKGVVIATGENTLFGNIVKKISEINKESAYEKSILYFSKLILRIILTTIILIFIANILLKGIDNIFEFFLFSIALIVTILPEALPTVVTFALSSGSLRMAKHNVVVKRLSAIEDLGDIEILCTDKTGTLTQNKISLEKIVSSDKKKCFLYGILSSGMPLGEIKIRDRILNPFDCALYERVPEDILKESEKFKIISELSFDSYRMRSSFLVQSVRSKKKFEKFLIVKGAPEYIIKICSKFSGSFDRKEIKEDIEKEGKEGKRVLALAFKKVEIDKYEIKSSDEKQLTFLGYFVFEDPLKPTAKEAIELSKKLGVQVKIITGDSKEVAGYVARRIGLVTSPADLISGEELEKLSKDDFDYACREKSVFARISPNIKYKIIKSLQKNYEVGFLGEGINDALALKTADVAIAVAGASDVSKEISDIVLLQKDLKVIVEGIKSGRMIFSNINKYIKCTLASNFGNFYSIAVISLFVNFLPMLPVQILLVNLLSDFPLISLATDSVDVEELKKPKMYQLHNVLSLIISLALVSTLFDFIFFSIFYESPAAVIQTLWFMLSILTEILLIYIIRTRRPFYKAKRPSFLLVFLTFIVAVLTIVLPFLRIGQNWFHFATPSIISLLIVFFLVGSYFITSELVKLIYFHYWKISNNK